MDQIEEIGINIKTEIDFESPDFPENVIVKEEHGVTLLSCDYSEINVAVKEEVVDDKDMLRSCIYVKTENQCENNEETKLELNDYDNFTFKNEMNDEDKFGMCKNIKTEEEPDVSESLPKKRPCRHFSVAEKEAIINMYKVCEKNHPDYSKIQKVTCTAEAAGVTSRSVYNILKSYGNTDTFEPPKKYHRARAVLDNIDDETRSAIRRIIHSFLLKNEPPTVKNILSEIGKVDEIPNFKETSFRHLLREIGFRFDKRSRMLKEKDEIICWRRGYLRSIKKARQQNKKIYYLDETWINNPFIKESLIVLHIGSKDGFVPNAQLVLNSKHTKDYHEVMNAQAFEKWFDKILPQLEGDCVIVLDNASCHTRKREKIPTSATKKTDVQNWLMSKEIAYAQEMVKVELLQLVKETGITDSFVVDEMAKATGRTVLRLPPYHSELNPLELIWPQIKSDVAQSNVTLTFADLKPRFEQAVQNVSPENWKTAVDHIIKEERRMWAMDDMIEIRSCSDEFREDNTFSDSEEN